MTLPTINPSGTSAEKLAERYTEAAQAIDLAISAVTNAMPRANDFRDAHSYLSAVTQHYEHVAKLQEVGDAMESLAKHATKTK